MKAQPLPPPGSPLELVIQRAFEILPNTAPFDTTGHPAMTVPCGLSGGLPIGLMLIGKHWGEAPIYQAAHAFEQMDDWRRSEAHTSELQALMRHSYAVFCLKKKNRPHTRNHTSNANARLDTRT